jgi:hypothetical protein
MSGVNGTSALMRMAGRLDGADPAAKDLLDRMSGLRLDSSQMPSEISQAGSLALPFA